MVKPNAKSPNKARKSLPSLGANGGTPNPKAANKLNTSVKTPGNKNATPGRKQKNPQQSPKPVAEQGVKPTPNKRNKRASGEGTEGSPAKKLKKFQGTAQLAEGAVVKGEKKKFVKGESAKDKKKGRAKLFTSLKDRVNKGDQTAVTDLEKRIKALEERKELTKTARRKLKLLLKFKQVLTGEEAPAKPKSETKKRRERKRQVKAKHAGEKAVKKEGDDDEEEESDSDDEAEVTPGQIIKTDTVAAEGDEESGEEEEESDDEDGEEEEESDDEAAVEKEEEGEDDSDSAPVEVAVEKTGKAGRRINVQYTQGGKKKGEEQKKETKAKNLKLQAMRNKGQLAGSVKENQKRSSRRNKKNKVNGA